mgnify:CR=1 FL=1
MHFRRHRDSFYRNSEPNQMIDDKHWDPDSALAFEDSTPGLLSARTAGLRCLLMPSPWDQELHRYQDQAVAVLDNLGSAQIPCT